MIFPFGWGGRRRRPRTGKGERIYAIGDIHGCYRQLRRLLGRIEAHHEALPPPASLRVVLLGDLIDRGPDSARVLRFAGQLSNRTPNLVTLMGNHEELMLGALAGDRAALDLWREHGGRATLASFGFDPARLDSERDIRLLSGQMRLAVSQPIIEWVRRLPLWTRSGDYLFVHAGVRPRIPLSRQQPDDLLWIRDDFLQWSGSFGGATIVHGHSIDEAPQLSEHRIGIDTGAYRTGVLTALYLEDDRQEFLSTASD
ncbi:MAG: metallophosphoesterase [Sphingomonas sp.]|nr:metallophosphoesterase [Sphingomonas sp.]